MKKEELDLKDLKWYVLCFDVNTSKATNFNIFIDDIRDGLLRELKTKSVYDKSTLKCYLKTAFIYYYYGKTECEFYIKDLHTEKFEKIDIWTQIKPNLDLIVDYINIKYKLGFK